MKYAVFVCALFLCFYTSAQNPTIERLQSKLGSNIPDSTRCQILDSLSMYTMFFTPRFDSTFGYCEKGINTAFPLPDKKYLILAYARLSFYYSNAALYKECLDVTYKGLDLAEQYHVPDYLSVLYYDLGWFYISINNYPEALAPVLKGISYLKFNKDPFFDQALHLYGMAGEIYQGMNKEDSALYYYRRMDSVAGISAERGARVIADYYRAEYYLSYKKDFPKADSVCLAAIAECRKSDHFLLGAFYIFSGYSLLTQNKIEEAFSKAKELNSLKLSASDRASQMYTADILSACYAKMGKPDSAYHYIKLKDSLSDLIQQHSNATEVQQFEFDGQLKRKEQEAAAILQTQKSRSKILSYVFLTAVAFFLLIAMIQWRNSRQRKKANLVLQEQKQKVESTLQELKSTQAQLIQSEKMASLGELTAGIAHEIQNPLNFVNNFSELNSELSDELNQEAERGNLDEVKLIAKNIQENSEKINHHGKRADGIVKGMLQHSRSGSGIKEPTDINALTEECLRLVYHGSKGTDPTFHAVLKTDLDPSIGKINIIPQDIGRVLLNLYNNAFYSVTEKMKTAGENYQPAVSVSTKKTAGQVILHVADNGIGIPQKVIDKIFQPFFTTKPTGQGTGLGLSLSYDIIKAHGGEIKVTSKENEGSEFIIELPVA